MKQLRTQEQQQKLDVEIIEKLWLLALCALQQGEVEAAEKLAKLIGDFWLVVSGTESEEE